jgi:hypothetical protein
MFEQPVNLSTVLYLGVFSRAEQRVLQAIFKAIAEDGGRCVATLVMLARDSNTSKSTTRNAIAQALAIGLLKKTERRSYCAVSLPNILTYGKAFTAPYLKATHEASLLPGRIDLYADRLNRERAQRFSEPSGLGQGVGWVNPEKPLTATITRARSSDMAATNKCLTQSTSPAPRAVRLKSRYANEPRGNHG